jgi:hypothetical protein
MMVIRLPSFIKTVGRLVVFQEISAGRHVRSGGACKVFQISVKKTLMSVMGMLQQLKFGGALRRGAWKARVRKRWELYRYRA